MTSDPRGRSRDRALHAQVRPPRHVHLDLSGDQEKRIDRRLGIALAIGSTRARTDEQGAEIRKSAKTPGDWSRSASAAASQRYFEEFIDGPPEQCPQCGGDPARSPACGARFSSAFAVGEACGGEYGRRSTRRQDPEELSQHEGRGGRVLDGGPSTCRR
jgi:hypothetical protein